MTAFPPPTVYPSRNGLPVLLSVPHAGRVYPEEVINQSTQGLRALQTLEDPFVDRLAWRAIAAGFGAVVQPVARAVIDCNRAETEVDPASIANVSPLPVGRRAEAGLGLVPSRTHKHGKLWRRPFSKTALVERLETIHRPYHRAIEVALDRLAIDHGQALLIDCHSMPQRRPGQAKIVIGDRHSSSAASWISRDAAQVIARQGFSVAHNAPYAGGHITERHGKPADGIHAIQIEVDRSMYLTEDVRSPSPAFDQVARLIETLARSLGESLLRSGELQAAE